MTADQADRDGDGDRDRDVDGRALNARRRDALGRPVARGEAGYEAEPREPLAGPDDALQRAQAFLDEGRAFAAHEVLEARWKQVRALAAAAGEQTAEDELWQGLAQLAVGHTHLQRGNATGARRLLERGSARLGASRQAAGRHGIATDALLATARRALDALEDRPAQQVAGELTWRLRQ